MTQVYFVGAGPGDPELITVKGLDVIRRAGVIIYAGSLVNVAVLAERRSDAQVHDSAGMTLEEVLEATLRGVAAGQTVARVHTGDPSLYGAIQEQIDALEAKGVACEVIPGVSSFTAAAAALRREFTLPAVSQTVILTRLEGRTPVPERERLESLAAHQASMCVFLSVQNIDEVARQLGRHYPPDTPVAVVQRASWPDEVCVRGTLADIAGKVKAARIGKTAQILVGRFLGGGYEKSRLYDKAFSHGHRTAEGGR
ncbi:MAG: precorrin-4 C(11)-methyltransferase [Candidatus Accumulibacter sp.]|jgi:precorrin-4/cobalt-precorrin-4 C11-methyltransferase|nr:precorrin-4 C(11)-methyltransferase [Accumulibacter sp.]